MAKYNCLVSDSPTRRPMPYFGVEAEDSAVAHRPAMLAQVITRLMRG